MSLLNAFLEIFKDAMLFFSHGTPNLTTVIPAMDHIDNTLATKSDSSQFSLPIRAALVIGKNTINRYYNKTDHSEVYCIAMSKYIHTFFSAFISIICSPASWIVLHPRHKLAYFKTQGWEGDWIETAYNLVHEEFDCSNASSAGVGDGDDDDDSAFEGSSDSVRAFTLCSYFFLTHLSTLPQPFSTNNIFDHLPSLAPSTAKIRDELDWYLSTDTENAHDGLLWWHKRCMTYPRLSRMARDYLSIPGKFSVFPHC